MHMRKPTAPDLSPLFLAGATATGKSEAALLLAEKLGGEIISVDSMQVYRGLDIGTAKLGAAERARVPHHLIDVVDLSETFDGAQFVRLARAAVAEIQTRGHRPIFCGGTGLYFKAFLEGLGVAPPADAGLRAALETNPLPELLAELQRLDPATFARIDRKNPRRVIRAVEVIRITGRPFSEQRAEWGDQTPRSEENPLPTIWGLARASADLHARISARVDSMFHRGLVAEVEKLLPPGLAANQTARQAIGYRQVLDHLRGERTLPETIELVKLRTRQFAKRQMTWFRRQARMNWLACAPEEGAESVARRISGQIIN
jgi:tRNA dimethylallyltransferase